MKFETVRRIEHVNLAPPRLETDDMVVLRLSRESLRAERPEVRFIGRVGKQQRLPWPA